MNFVVFDEIHHVCSALFWNECGNPSCLFNFVLKLARTTLDGWLPHHYLRTSLHHSADGYGCRYEGQRWRYPYDTENSKTSINHEESTSRTAKRICIAGRKGHRSCTAHLFVPRFGKWFAYIVCLLFVIMFNVFVYHGDISVCVGYGTFSVGSPNSEIHNWT